MGLIKSVKDMCGDVNEKANAFLEKHATGVMAAEAGAGALVLLTGSVSAAVTGEAAAYYGMSIVDIVLVAVGAIGFMVGAILRDFRVLALGGIILVLGGVANYLGV